MERTDLVAALVGLGAVWHDSASAYVRSIRYPVQFADERLMNLVETLLPFSVDDSRVLDAGASHGCISALLSARYPNIPILATSWLDQNVSGLIAAKRRLGWDSVDIQKTALADFSSFAPAAFTHIFNNQSLALHQNPQQQLEDTFRILRPGGILAITIESLNIWLVSWTQTVRETIDPKYNPQSVFNEDVCDSANLGKMLRAVGFEDVRAQTIVCPHSPEQDIPAIIDELFKGRLPDFQGLTPGVTDKDLERARPSLGTYLAKKYSQNKRRPANVMILAVARRPEGATAETRGSSIPPPVDDLVMEEEEESEEE